MNTFSIAGCALLPDGFAEATIAIADARIAAVTRGLDPRADLKTPGWIAPGFIDLQVNGGFGFDATTDGAAVAEIAARLPATGVTAFLPTLISSPLDAYPPLLRAVAAAAQPARGAQILGVHLEGPYLNPQRAGAHNPNYLRAPEARELEVWAGSPLVRLATLAPELPGAGDLIRQLRARGVVVSAGHSAANWAQAVAGFQAGIAWGTHLFNAMSPLAHRAPGLVGALLSSDVPCGLIADGVHVHPAAVKIAWRAKGARGLTLVTDATAAMGMGAGRYRLGDRDVILDGTSTRLADGTLAGSVLQMDAAIRNGMTFTGCSLAEAITMASTVPARVIGLEHKGRIAPGYDADLVVLDEALRVQLTIARGEIIFER